MAKATPNIFPNCMQKKIFSIGHSNHPFEHFLAFLKQHEITAVADVRSIPYSQRIPHFNREHLRQVLAKDDIAYVFLGKELGARSTDMNCYENGRVSFLRLAATELFRQGLDRIVDGAASHRIALLCAERDPLRCHRTILVSRHLAERGLAVNHILSDGSIESHADAIKRLLAETGHGQPSLLATPEQEIAEAFIIRGEEIAFRIIGDDHSMKYAIRETER